MNSNHRSSSTKSHEDEEGSDSSPLVPRKSVSPSKPSAAASRRHRRPVAVQRNASDRTKHQLQQQQQQQQQQPQPHARAARRRASLQSDVLSAVAVDVVRTAVTASSVSSPVGGAVPLATTGVCDDDAAATLIRRSRRPSPLFEVLATAAASSGDSESTALKDGSDENSSVAAASKHGSSSSLTRRSARASVLSDVLTKNRCSDEFRSAATSETTGSFLVAHSAEHNNATSSASPLPDSGASVAVGDDARLWIGDLKQVERIISFQRSSSGRHGISETASGRLITHPIVLTGPSPSKDDDDASSTTLSAGGSAVGLPPRSQQLSFGSSLSSSDLDDARNAPATKTKAAAAAAAAASRASSRRRHRARPVVLPTIDSAAKDLHDVLHAMGVTSLVVPDAVIVDLVLAPTSIAALDNEALHDARSDDEPDSASESSSTTTSAPAAVAASSPPSSTSCSPGDVLGPLVSRSMSPDKPQSPPPPLLSSPPRSRNNSATSKSPPSRSATPSGGDSLTYVTVDDRRERIVSMRTSRSGRHTVTQTESGTLITQPVFFSPGGVVQTDTVPIYMAEGASRRRSER
jgi:trimeric autotransporter adhesin